MPAGATYEPIATTTLGSATNTFTFSTISGSYTDLRLVIVTTPSTSLQVFMRFNGISTTTYSGTEFRADGSSAGSDRYTNDTGAYFTWGYLVTSAQPVLLTADIFSYAGATNKTLLTTMGQDRNGTGVLERGVHLWRSTSAITSIETRTTTGNFGVGTTATLYGIKAA